MKSDEVAVGDLNSAERGSGARKNAGKPQWWQLPVFALRDVYPVYWDATGRHLGTYATLSQVIDDMASWQRMRLNPAASSETLTYAISRLIYLLADEQKILHGPKQLPLRALESTVRVLEFGAVKYKPGNWAKGMPWSVCFSCAISHLFAAGQGEFADQESGLSHLAHAMCNLLFLKSYETLYPEGDDRLTEWAIPARNEPDPDEDEIDAPFVARAAGDLMNRYFRDHKPKGENI